MMVVVEGGGGEGEGWGWLEWFYVFLVHDCGESSFGVIFH